MSVKPAKRRLNVKARLQSALVANERALKKLCAAQATTEARLEKLRARLAISPETLAYQALLKRLRMFVGKHLPRKATALIVTKGDPALLEQRCKTAWHFPRTVAGGYAGYHPSGDLAAIVQLEAWRAAGADFFVLPQPYFWWLEHYSGFRRHLEGHYHLIARTDNTAAIWSLTKSPNPGEKSLVAQFAEIVGEFQSRCEREPVVLNSQAGDELEKHFPQLTLFKPPEARGPFPYLDGTADIVVTTASGGLGLSEARRVASAVVVRLDKAKRKFSVKWLPDCPRGNWPGVSIVMPCHNGRTMTDACLRSLLETLPRGVPCEVIVVDDCSSDGTAAMLKRWAKRDVRVRVLRNKKNLGFVDTCNFGASKATGEILVFLNNDLVLLPGWLEPLLRVFRDRADAGVCGGKLIFPDGTLQEAGGVIFRDGSAMNYGRASADLNAPDLNFLREVDYCSGALFATRRELFQQLGGFGSEYRPGYYEDGDYCFKVRAAGRKVYFQPESAVVHREGGTAGTDLKRGMKRYQVVNQKTFLNRWKVQLTGQPPRPRNDNFAARLVLSGRSATARRRVLVCALMPECDRDSGSRRVFDLLVFLQEAGWAVTFVSHHENYEPRYARVLQQRGIAVFGGAGRWMNDLIAAGDYDLAVFGLWHVAEPFVSAWRTLSPRTRIVVDSIDLHFLRLARGTFAGGGGKLLDANYASEMMRELNTYATVDAVLTVSPKEAGLINDFTAEALAHAVPDNEDLPVSPVPLRERNGLVFVGCYRHMPNVGAVEFLCQEILPRVNPALLKKHPVHIVGDGLDEKVRAFGRDLPAVRMVGWTPSVMPYIARARVTVIPLRFGAGTKRKALQSLMLGTPAVSTSIGAEGFGLRDGEEIFIADNPELFARRITQLLEDDELWTRFARAGREHIVELHGRAAVRARLEQVIAQVMAKPAKQIFLTHANGEIKPGKLPHLVYSRLVTAFGEAVAKVTPRGGTVLVASRGDEELLRFSGRKGRHYPQGKSGGYAGHHPADSAAAIAQLEKLRRRGGQFFALPATAFWWLDHYREFAAHMTESFTEVFRHESVGVIYDLRGAKNNSNAGADNDAVKLIAFHLPQFHPIPENDAWWGEGFTEWTNVRRAKPAFAGHYQPHVPAGLGYYDLRNAKARAAQAELARAHGVSGFCYYHYWFGGKRLLERPFNEILASGQPDFPFCLCWANEPWSRRWDGQAENILQPQIYSPEDDEKHIRWLIPALQDKRAIQIEGKPVFVVYQGRDLPDPARTIETWRREVAAAGLPGIYLMSVETGWDAGWDATQAGFDAKILFAPQFTTLFKSGAQIRVPGKDTLRVFDYQKAWPVLANPDPVKYLRYETVCSGWDNSARRGDEAVVLHNATPAAYEQWLREAITRAQARPAGQRVVFLNAWNEWAEGAHLEPDLKNGLAYLQATKRALANSTKPAGPRRRQKVQV